MRRVFQKIRKAQAFRQLCIMVPNKSWDDRFMFSPDVNTTLINTNSGQETLIPHSAPWQEDRIRVSQTLRHVCCFAGSTALSLKNKRQYCSQKNTHELCMLWNNFQNPWTHEKCKTILDEEKALVIRECSHPGRDWDLAASKIVYWPPFHDWLVITWLGKSLFLIDLLFLIGCSSGSQ